MSSRAARGCTLTDGVERSLETLRLGAEGLSTLVTKQDQVVQELVNRSAQQLEWFAETAQASSREALESLAQLGDMQVQRAMETEAKTHGAAQRFSRNW